MCHYMPCRISSNECELDRWIDDCVTAHKQAKQHEARYADHWITLYDPPGDDTASAHNQRSGVGSGLEQLDPKQLNCIYAVIYV